MPTPEVKENFPVCTCAGRLLGGQKGRGRHPIICVDMHPQASVLTNVVLTNRLLLKVNILL